MRRWRGAGTQVGRPGREGAKSASTLVCLHGTAQAGSENSFEKRIYNIATKFLCLHQTV